MNIFLLASNEEWVCDRFTEEFYKFNPDITTTNMLDSDIIWMLAGWRWKTIPLNLLQLKKVVITVHHIVENKFNEQKHDDFMLRDRYVDCYHVPCKKTFDQLKKFTTKKIFILPFWVNQNIWFNIENKKALRKKFNIGEDSYLIGSYQRDTEGSDLKTPKLEKGPDIFCDIVEKLYEKNKKIEIILAGWRRQYIINRLSKSSINFNYFELPEFKTLNELYNILDLYIVSSRCEGGPQSIVECALTKTPIISTNVGIAENILSNESIFEVGDFNASPNIDTAYRRVQKYLIPSWFEKYKMMMEDVLNV